MNGEERWARDDVPTQLRLSGSQLRFEKAEERNQLLFIFQNVAYRFAKKLYLCKN